MTKSLRPGPSIVRIISIPQYSCVECQWYVYQPRKSRTTRSHFCDHKSAFKDSVYPTRRHMTREGKELRRLVSTTETPTWCPVLQQLNSPVEA